MGLWASQSLTPFFVATAMFDANLFHISSSVQGVIFTKKVFEKIVTYVALNVHDI
jgi:hypothetical protein